MLWLTAGGLHLEVTCRDDHKGLRIEVLAHSALTCFGSA
jgi:hypothetical protein